MEFETCSKDIRGEINQNTQDLMKEVGQAKKEVGEGIKRVQSLATGAALISLEGPGKVGLMQARLKAFGACVRGGGGEGCVMGKG